MHWVFWISIAAMFYVHAGYWLLLRIIPGRRRNRVEVTLPHVSLIIPAYNEAQCLAAKLRNVLDEIDYPRDCLEIIVASDGSSDATVAIARSFEARGVRVLDFDQRRGKASVLNDAVAAASNDVLCLCDANVFFDRQALRRLVGRLADPDVGAATADVRLASEDSNFGRGESIYYRLERSVQSDESRIGTTICVDGGMYVLRRELYRKLRADTVLDDFVTSMNVIRAGKQVVYEPDAVAHEDGLPLARQEFMRRIRVSAGAVQAVKRGDFPPPWRAITFWQFLSHKLLRWAGPIWLILILVSSLALWREGPLFQAVLAGQLLFYALAVAGTCSVRFRDTTLGGGAFYFAMSHLAMAIGTVKGLFNLQHAAWKRTQRSHLEIPTQAATGAP